MMNPFQWGPNLSDDDVRRTFAKLGLSGDEQRDYFKRLAEGSTERVRPEIWIGLDCKTEDLS